MTDNATPDGVVRPQSIIGPITLGVNNGSEPIELDLNATVTPAELGLAGAVHVTGITHSSGSLTIDTERAPITITGIAGGSSPAIPPGSTLISIARTPTHVVAHLQAGGHETALPFPAGTGSVTVCVSAPNAR